MGEEPGGADGGQARARPGKGAERPPAEEPREWPSVGGKGGYHRMTSGPLKVTRPAAALVVSWYDSGARLAPTAFEAAAEKASPTAIPAPAAPGVVTPPPFGFVWGGTF